jgi:hypothetical protein
MKLKKNYRFNNKRQIWRLIPTNTGKLIIEEREPDKKQVFFNCLELDSGKKIFKDLQPENNFWMGIETVRDDIIFFHKFAKPDMPKHKGIFVFDIKSKNFIWENPEFTFLFLFKDKIFVYKEKFEGRVFFSINILTGEVVEELGNNHEKINQLRNESLLEENMIGCLFPEIYEQETQLNSNANNFFSSLRNDFVISGKIEFILKDELLLMSFHTVNSKGSFDNLFKAVDLSRRKYILEETISKETSLYLSDSFFVKDNFLLLLFGKTRLEVYKIIF